jgi:hypothetical protein
MQKELMFNSAKYDYISCLIYSLSSACIYAIITTVSFLTHEYVTIAPVLIFGLMFHVLICLSLGFWHIYYSYRYRELILAGIISTIFHTVSILLTTLCELSLRLGYKSVDTNNICIIIGWSLFSLYAITNIIANIVFLYYLQNAKI